MKPAYLLPQVLLLAACVEQVGADVFDRSRVQILCHRTANQDAPENTLESLEESARLGCDIVELDVSRTLDGNLVLLHDGPIDRISSGSGIVENLLFEELRLYDAGEWMGARFKGFKAPLFEDALRMARRLRLRLIVDIKSNGIGAEILQALRHENMLDRVRFGGQWADVRALYPEANRQQTATWNGGMQAAEVAALKKSGRFVIANFSNSEHELDVVMMKRAVDAGVDVVNTDYPRIASEAVGRPVEARISKLVAEATAGSTSAIAALAGFRDFRLTSVFLKLHASQEHAVSRAAAVALVRTQDRSAWPALRTRLSHRDAQVAANAAWALGMLADNDSRAALEQAADRSEIVVAREAMLALSRIPGPVDVRLILRKILDPDPLVTGGAALAAARHGRPNKAALIEAAGERLRESIRRFGEQHPVQPGVMPPPDVLEQSLAYYRGYQKVVAAKAIVGGAALRDEALRAAADMTQIGATVAGFQLWDRDRADLAPLIEALASPQVFVRNRAMWTLIKAEAAGPDLKQAWFTSSIPMRMRLAQILAWRGEHDAIPLLEQAAREESEGQAVFRWALKKLRETPQ